MPRTSHPDATRRLLLAGGLMAAGMMMAPRIATAQARENLDRVNALIARMTIEEKAGQLNLQNDPFRWRPEGVNPGDALDANQEQTAEDIRAGRIGALFNGPMMGIGILTAGLILSVMIIPFIASVMRDVFDTCPGVLKESAYAIGCTRWEVVRHIVLPYTRIGVVGGVMLGLGRALGETMAVTFVIGNAHKLSWSLFAPGNSIASTLANEFAEAEAGMHMSSLFALGLILFVITFIVLAAAKLLLISLESKEGSK